MNELGNPLESRAGKKRLKIFALHSNRATLSATAGDMINEARFLTSLSQFADVYYNGMLFQPDAPNYGLEERPITVPEPVYDLYYVRANPEIFLQLPHPKITMAYPYFEEVFKAADALVVTTDTWKRGLTPYSKTNHFSDCMRHWYGDSIHPPKALINIRQTIDTDFIPDPPEFEIREAQARLTLGKALGYFGRIDSNTFPNILLEAVTRVHRKYPEVILAVAGTVRIPLAPEILRLARLPHEKMPALLSACTATVTDEGNDSLFLGSGKVLDSMARGVPVIAFKSPARVEQLGEHYPLYYQNEFSCRQCIEQVVFDEDVRQEARRHLAIRARRFMPDARARELQIELEELVKLCAPRPAQDVVASPQFETP